MSFDPEKRFIGQWCKDSETSEEVLMNCETNKEVYRKPIAKKDFLRFVGDALFLSLAEIVVFLFFYAVSIRLFR